MKNLRKIKELEDRIKSLEDFKYKYELKETKKETLNELKLLEKKHKVDLEFFIERSYNYLDWYYIRTELGFDKSYVAYIKINNHKHIEVDISGSKNFKEAYDCVDYEDLEKEIKSYLYDNRKQNKPKKVIKKRIKKEEESK